MGMEQVAPMQAVVALPSLDLKHLKDADTGPCRSLLHHRGPFLGAQIEESSLPKASATVQVPYLSHCAGQGVGRSLGLPGAPSAEGREQD